MTIDIRAVVSCSLGGDLISGTVSDDYVQGSGLIKTRGSCEISGIVTPVIGDVVTFSYTKKGVTTQLPRVLRVLSSFADPFRRTTSVELGCKLTYLENFKEPLKRYSLYDPLNVNYTYTDSLRIVFPLSAQWIMDTCLTKLGISASSNPLTSLFSTGEFDLSRGYVAILGDLLLSESYCGYLDVNEILQVFSLDQSGGTGPVLDQSKIINIGGIGSGQLPGEAVIVSYNTLRLKPSLSSTPAWTTTTNSSSYSLKIPFSMFNALTQQNVFYIKTYNISDTVETTTKYKNISIPNGSGFDIVSVVDSKTTKLKTQTPTIAGGLITEYLSNNISFESSNINKITEETYEYDQYGNEIKYTRIVKGSVGYVVGSLGVPYVFSITDYITVNWDAETPIEAEIRKTSVAGQYKQVETYIYGQWAQTPQGQQAIAASRDSFATSLQVSNFINFYYTNAYHDSPNGFQGLSLLDSRVEIESSARASIAPSGAQIINAANATGGDPANGNTTYSTTELVLALGSSTAQRHIEFSLPYSPDDIYTGPPYGPYSSLAGDAYFKSKQFGLVQNRLLLGNRSGMNIQAAPESLPTAPFAPLIVQANGLSALYRTNGTNWTMSKEGVVVSTDALFWGAVAGMGTFWFPVAPGITSLPTTPAVVNGQMTVTNVVPVWNQTELLTAGTRTGITLQSYGYAFAVTTSLELKTRTGVTNAQTTVVVVPNAHFVVTAPVPVVASSNNNINVPLATIAINGIVPSQIGRPRTTVSIPSKAISVVAKVPSVLSGSAVGVPAATVRISVPYLYVDTGKDPGGQTPGIPDLYTPTQDWQPEPWAS